MLACKHKKERKKSCLSHVSHAAQHWCLGMQYAMRDFQLSGGYSAPKGSLIMPSIVAASMQVQLPHDSDLHHCLAGGQCQSPKMDHNHVLQCSIRNGRQPWTPRHWLPCAACAACAPCLSGMAAYSRSSQPAPASCAHLSEQCSSAAVRAGHRLQDRTAADAGIRACTNRPIPMPACSLNRDSQMLRSLTPTASLRRGRRT